ncbi:sugar phosphate isomerase/epimerase family protein [Hufsiella ginkgonis]|uniref:TIM barrel protein n=1 Tax=Hufsiella ginkgonis TaxID=2695274 RepID=A0A7K1XW56_9SPHI|nr:sugar phosphate isomerase/epimerase family protein [Hufsiella ginkgonis]MXV15214.1 TIM barrel protein [Hufsiella ginkgonis]
MNRRKFIGRTALLAGGLLFPAISKAGAAKKQRYKVAVIDLMILKRQKLSAFPLAKELGADGLEVDMGGLGDRETFDSQLGDGEMRKQFLAKARELNVEICSLAMTGFYAQSFAERPTYQRMIRDCFDAMKAMDVKIAFLPLGIKGDLVKYPELRPAIVERLKVVAMMAAKAGVIVGIETALDAAGEVALLNEIGSKHIQVYFNFSNPLKAGRDLHQELRILGKKRICQIHCTDEDGVWLQNNTRLDLKKVKQTLDSMGWKGWLVIERSRDAKEPTNVKKNFTANTAYVKSVFQE